MPFLLESKQKSIKLQLSRNLTRAIKRGHPWVYGEALRSLPPGPRGAPAILLDNRGGREIGRGYYDSQGVITLRICTTHRGERLDDRWALARMANAVSLRQSLFDDGTTAYRVFNGEGDGLPGLVCDRYQDAAVLKLDGEAARNFWDTAGIAHWLADRLGLRMVYERLGSEADVPGRALVGPEPVSPVSFLENDLEFTADIIHGQKTGFFLDQRENRLRMGAFVARKRILNVFGYTGGFSVYAGAKGALHVTTVDSASPALDVAIAHWELNGLPADRHVVVRSDAFKFLDAALAAHESWDTVILDPPSFAPSQGALSKALNAYKKLVSAGAKVTVPDGILAVGSCSSHVTMEDFLNSCREGISDARRQAVTLGIYTQPPDHPTPLAMPEFRYLKFIIMRLTTS